jgi:hypothetical protein
LLRSNNDRFRCVSCGGLLSLMDWNSGLNQCVECRTGERNGLADLR